MVEDWISNDNKNTVAVEQKQNDNFVNREYLSLFSVVYILVGKIYF